MPGFFAKRETRFKVSPAEERTRNGIVYSSKLEMNFDVWMEEFGVTQAHIHRQVKFELQASFRFKPKHGKPFQVRSISLIPDFVIGEQLQQSPGVMHPDILVIDAKGVETPQFRLKRALFMRRYGIEIHAVKTKKKLLELLIQNNVPISGEITKSVVPGRAGKPASVRKSLSKK